MEYMYTALATVLAIIVTFIASVFVGKARTAYKIDGPAMTGHEGLERAVRAHANTVEQLVLFLPALWLAAYVGASSDIVLGAVGGVWSISRLWYGQKYRAASNRAAPFIIGIIALLYLVVVILWTVISGML